MYLPAAFAGVLLPYALSLRPPNQAAGVHGAALAHAALAAVMSLFGLKSGFAFALWAMAGVAGLLCPKEVTPPITPHCMHRWYTQYQNSNPDCISFRCYHVSSKMDAGSES